MIEILDIVDTGRRRRFSVSEKVRIVEESLVGPNLARSTARRHGIALSGLYLWRRQYRRGELGGSEPAFRLVAFLTEPAAAVAPQPCAASGRLEILLSNGRRVILSVGVDMEALARLLPRQWKPMRAPQPRQARRVKGRVRRRDLTWPLLPCRR
ncbi:MAG: transposase [Rhodobacter sp.]|nr:transposase [Rhodobacter sp.]